MRDRHAASPGFTLLEAVATLVVASFAGVMLLAIMNPGVSRSAEPVLIVQDESDLERIMEWVTGDYVRLLNQSPDTALGTVATTNYPSVIPGYPPDIVMTREYLTFDNVGNPAVSGSATPTLRVALTSPTHTLSALFTAARTDASDPRIKY